MRVSLTTTLWATFAGSAVASNVARYPESADIVIAPPVRRDVAPRDIELDRLFNINKLNQDLMDFDDFEVNCIECQINGKVNALLDDRIDLPESNIKLTFDETSGYIDLRLLVGAQRERSLTLWGLPDEANLGKSTIKVGLGLHVDLVVSVEGELEAEGGFKFTIPEGSFLQVNLKGQIESSSFSEAVFEPLDWHVTRGQTIIRLALRIRADFGAEFRAGRVGLGAMVGAYLNLLEVDTTLKADPSNEVCKLEGFETFNINAGAYVEKGFFKASHTFTGAPKTSTTFYQGPTASQCLVPVSTTEDIPPPIYTPTSSAPITETPAPVTPTPPANNVTKTWDNAHPPVIPTTSSTFTYTRHNGTITTPPVMHTSTVCATEVYTFTSCAAPVINCPAEWAQTITVTKIVELYTTVCPVTEEQPTHVPATPTKPARVITITSGYTFTRCPTPIVNDFTPPAGVEPPSEHDVTVTVSSTLKDQKQKATSVVSATTVAPHDGGKGTQTAGGDNVAKTTQSTGTGVATISATSDGTRSKSTPFVGVALIMMTYFLVV